MNDKQIHLLRAIDAMNQLKWNKQLLDIATEQASTFNEKNFDRVCVLLDSFKAMWDGELDELDFNLNQLLIAQDEKTT